MENLNRRFFLKALALFGLVPAKAMAEDQGLPVVKFDEFNNMSNHKELLKGIPFKRTYHVIYHGAEEYKAEREVWVPHDDAVDMFGYLRYGKMILRNTFYKYSENKSHSCRYHLCPINDTKSFRLSRRYYVYGSIES